MPAHAWIYVCWYGLHVVQYRLALAHGYELPVTRRRLPVALTCATRDTPAATGNPVMVRIVIIGV